MRFEIGSEFAGYTVMSRLGRGGMATVYLVREPGLERLVALKVLPQQLVDDQQFGPRFEQEARVIGSLDHPHIIPVYRYGITDDVPWMALRYVDGGDFAARLVSRPLALGEGFVILRGVASALDYAHRKNIVHRDIKPQNILLSSEGSAYLADFGVAKLLQASTVSHTLIGGIVGSPAYMAPEQAQGHAIGPHTDIYSLAVICFQWLTGSLPFEADTPHAILLKHVLEPLPTEALTLLAPPVAAALQRGMAKKPEDRYPTAGHLIAALEQAMYAPVLNTFDGLPALTPSGLRAVSGFERRVDTPTGLSRPVVPPDPRVDTPTTLSRAVVEPVPAPLPPSPLSRPPPDPSLARTHVTSEPVNRVSEMLQAIKPVSSGADSGSGPAGPGIWLELRRPLAFAALGAALLVVVYLGWRMLSADPADPATDVAAATTVSEDAVSSTPAPTEVEPAPAKDFAELKRELEESDRNRAESLAKGPASADSGTPSAETAGPAKADPAIEAAAARVRELEERLAETERLARLAESRRIAQEEAARRSAEAQSPSAKAPPDTASARPPAATASKDIPAQAATGPGSPPSASAATQPSPASATTQTTAPPAVSQPQSTGSPPDRASAAPAAAVGGFTEKGGGVLTHVRTGNEWSQSDNGSSIDWKEAQRHCRKRGSGWRLPNGQELLGLIKSGGGQSTGCGNAKCRVSPLFDLSASSFWTTEQRGRTVSMVVYLNTGNAEGVPIERGSPRALCIRKR